MHVHILMLRTEIVIKLGIFKVLLYVVSKNNATCVYIHEHGVIYLLALSLLGVLKDKYVILLKVWLRIFTGRSRYKPITPGLVTDS